MKLTMFKGKIHRATVTEADLNYEGSIGVDEDLLDAAGIFPYERVDVLNINNGERFSTYTIPMPRGNGDITINGAAARLAQKGDRVILIAYCQANEDEAKNIQPKIVLMGDNNQIISS